MLGSGIPILVDARCLDPLAWQSIVNGFQHEQPDYWLTFGNPWEIERLIVSYPIKFYGHVSVGEINCTGIRCFAQLPLLVALCM